MDSFLKPHTTSCTTKDCWVFSFWFQSLEGVNCCRQSEVMSWISFTRRCVLLVVWTAVPRKPFSTFSTYLMFKNYPEKVDRWLENLIERNESQMTTLHATLDRFIGTLTTTNMASCTSPQWLRIFSTMLAQKYKIWRLKLPKWTK